VSELIYIKKNIMELETVIGLEIHAQLNTKSKLFSRSDNDAFGANPNTRIDEVDLGLPGTLPVLNDSAVKKACSAAAALGGDIQRFSKFDRKQYFYPDLPFGYQISQFDQPLSLGGQVQVEVEGELKSFAITRVHIENDAGKLTHEGETTYCDYNRAGSPLIEIVTEPDLRTPMEAQALAKEIQKILRFVNASDADMEKGMMRFDASISLRPKGETKLYARTEIKNLNSFQSLVKSLKYEQKRQTDLWNAGTPQTQQTTAGWLDDKGETHVLRDKESAADYRFFPEPDLPPITFTEAEITKIKASIPELPLAKYLRYQAEFDLSQAEALKISEDKFLAEFFETTTNKSNDGKKSASLILSVVLAQNNWRDTYVTPALIADTIKLLQKDKISSSGAKDIIYAGMKKSASAIEIMKELDIEQSSDTGALDQWVDQVIAQNPDAAAEFKENPRVFSFLMGQLMKMSRGQANPKMANTVLRDKLNKL
jgi:aspartyl-tRNA(Asn)/glutamyl-tRNA(Gln) amidotransferase subunit B